jgi:membrane associated rhomboid family serine protease
MLLILVLNILVFAYEMLIGSVADLDVLFTSAGVVPVEFTRGVEVGAPPPLGVHWTTLFTSMFLHGGLLHIASNMLYLFVFGDNVEDRLGSGTYLVFYLLCGIVAAVGQGLIAPSPMLGASGAIAGVLGAYLVLSPGARIRTLIFLGIFITVVQLPAVVVIGFFVVIQFVEGFASLRLTGHAAAEQVAYFAHIFGFFAGVVLLLLLRDRTRRDAAAYGRYG